tara:strand:+ start:1115 stop:1237 length:123 start_codon:yes stop_codon:yes gene_type:complete
MRSLYSWGKYLVFVKKKGEALKPLLLKTNLVLYQIIIETA